MCWPLESQLPGTQVLLHTKGNAFVFEKKPEVLTSQTQAKIVGRYERSRIGCFGLDLSCCGWGKAADCVTLWVSVRRNSWVAEELLAS
jgi:hypothetical protein